MELSDILITVAVIVLVVALLVKKFQGHPSNKYHNDSWKKRKSDQ